MKLEDFIYAAYECGVKITLMGLLPTAILTVEAALVVRGLMELGVFQLPR